MSREERDSWPECLNSSPTSLSLSVYIYVCVCICTWISCSKMLFLKDLDPSVRMQELRSSWCSYRSFPERTEKVRLNVPSLSEVLFQVIFVCCDGVGGLCFPACNILFKVTSQEYQVSFCLFWVKFPRYFSWVCLWDTLPRSLDLVRWVKTSESSFKELWGVRQSLHLSAQVNAFSAWCVWSGQIHAAWGVFRYSPYIKWILWDRHLKHFMYPASYRRHLEANYTADGISNIIPLKLPF